MQKAGRIGAIAVESRISQGSEAGLRLENGRVVLYPIKPPEYSLEELLAAVSKGNLHQEVDTGDAVGREAG